MAPLIFNSIDGVAKGKLLTKLINPRFECNLPEVIDISVASSYYKEDHEWVAYTPQQLKTFQQLEGVEGIFKGTGRNRYGMNLMGRMATSTVSGIWFGADEELEITDYDKWSALMCYNMGQIISECNGLEGVCFGKKPIVYATPEGSKPLATPEIFSFYFAKMLPEDQINVFQRLFMYAAQDLSLALRTQASMMKVSVCDGVNTYFADRFETYGDLLNYSPLGSISDDISINELGENIGCAALYINKLLSNLINEGKLKFANPEVQAKCTALLNESIAVEKLAQDELTFSRISLLNLEALNSLVEEYHSEKSPVRKSLLRTIVVEFSNTIAERNKLDEEDKKVFFNDVATSLMKTNEKDKQFYGQKLEFSFTGGSKNVISKKKGDWDVEVNCDTGEKTYKLKSDNGKEYQQTKEQVKSMALYKKYRDLKKQYVDKVWRANWVRKISLHGNALDRLVFGYKGAFFRNTQKIRAEYRKDVSVAIEQKNAGKVAFDKLFKDEARRTNEVQGAGRTLARSLNPSAVA